MRAGIRVLIPFILIFVITPFFFGCSQIRSKESFNEGSQAFNSGNYAKAENCFRRAVELNPENQKAKLFYATALQAQYISNKQNMENVAMARKALNAYQAAISSSTSLTDLDLAHAAVAELHRDLGETEESRNWLIRRINLTGQTDEARFKSYYALAVGYWQESEKIMQPYRLPGSPSPQYRAPHQWQSGEAERARDVIKKGLEYLAAALKIDPSCADCFKYRSMLNNSLSWLETGPAQKAIVNEAEADLEKFYELKRNERN